MIRRCWPALAAVGLAILLGSCGGQSPPQFNPTPAITNLFPSNITAGSQDVTLFVVGTGFSPLKSGVPFVYWNGSPRSTTLNTTTGELEAQILASDVAVANTANVTVVNPGPGGGQSQPPSVFTIEKLQAGAPSISGFSPTSAAGGGKAFTLTVNGANFVANDVVTWNGELRTTTFVNANQVTADINAADIADAGSASVAVFTSDPTIGSQSTNFPITGPNNPAPKASSLSPSSIAKGSGDLEVTVKGSGFVSNSVVEWNATGVATAFVSSSELVAVIPAADLSSSTAAMIDVTNPAPGGGTSQQLTFTVN